jgi:hypothetical protein
MAKGNICINKSIAKEVVDGKIIQDIPEAEHNGEMFPLFTVIPPTQCSVCGSKLRPNENYDRSIISSYSIIICPTTYWICTNKMCKKHHTDKIIGVTGSANYSDEFIEKVNCIRYGSHCSLWNTRFAGEIFTVGLTDDSGRAPCATTIWKYEQIQGRISSEELSNQKIDFNGKLYIDGYWVKAGWRKYIEAQIGRKFTTKQWKRIRNKIIYVVATEDYVVMDFQITNNKPSYLELLPLLKRIKNRIPEEQILKIVSDEDNAIIGSVKAVFPNVSHSFCVFHQLKNVTKKYLDEFGKIDNIPHFDRQIYELATDLILSESIIHLSVNYRNIMEMFSDRIVSKASEKVFKYIKEIYPKNRELLEAGFTPETNNVMEQLFSMINDFVNQVRSFKTKSGLANFFYNLFVFMNKRKFNTGKWKGHSPLDRAIKNCG